MPTPLNVPSALELLLEEVESVINEINQRGGEAFQHGRHAEARQLLDQVETNTTFRAKIVALRREWDVLHPPSPSALPQQAVRAPRSEPEEDYSRLPNGVRTPERAFRLPLLRTIVALGGSARTRDVLDRMESEVARFLRPVDHEPLPSDPKSIRWRNTAQWARFVLVEEGLLKSESPNGIWEITEKGRQLLAASPAQPSNGPPEFPALEVDKPSLLAAARPVQRIRGVRGGRMKVLFGGGMISFDLGDSAIQAPAKGHWPGVAIADAKILFKWLRKPDLDGQVRVALKNGFLEINRMRTPSTWQPSSTSS
jgi:hypothetical protein